MISTQSARQFSCIESLEPRIAPATFLVTSLLDDNSTGTLRDAVAAANLTPAADTIVFKAGLTGTITIDPAQNAIHITAPLSIKGPGIDKITVSGASTNRAFFITDSDDAKSSPVSISNLALIGGTNGTNGGVIVDFEPLTLTNVVVTGGSVSGEGGGLWASTSGNVSMTGCKIISNTAPSSGGGVSITAANVTINNTLISGNTATNPTSDGGGAFIFAKNSMRISNSLISQNSSGFFGGGLRIDTNIGQKVTIQNTTFDENSTGIGGGALEFGQGMLLLTGSTFHHNQAERGAALDATNLHIAVTIQKNVFTENKATGTGSIDTGVLAYLGGGPLTISGSQFLGNTSAGDGAAIILDSGASVSVSASLFTGNSAQGSGGAISLAGSEKLTLKGDAFLANNAVDDGGALFVDMGGAVSISGGIFRANSSGNDGGALYADGTASQSAHVTVTGALFQQNDATVGGAVQIDGLAVATFTGTHFTENVAQSGAALEIFHAGSIFTMKGSLFRGNLGNNTGAVAISGNNTVVISSSGFFDNAAGLSGSGNGGGLFIASDAGSVTLSALTIMHNNAATGGGIYNAGASTILLGGTITGNYAATDPNRFGI